MIVLSITIANLFAIRQSDLKRFMAFSSDINSRRGRIEGMEDVGGGRIVHGFVPLSEMFGYSTDLRSRTQGRGNYSMFFDHYEKVPKNVQEKILDAHLAAQNK